MKVFVLCKRALRRQIRAFYNNKTSRRDGILYKSIKYTQPEPTDITQVSKNLYDKKNTVFSYERKILFWVLV